MLMFPSINPVALTLGPLKVHWYGVMYMLGFVFFVVGGKWWIKKFNHPFITDKLIDDMLFYGVLGVVIGGRLGYCIFYQPQYYMSHPVDIIKTWTGGMSFHGGMLGVIFSIFCLAKLKKINFFILTDFIAPFIPMSLFLGRIGNFINGELWGRVVTTNIPWAMIYPQSGSMLPRHPSQIYESLSEGLILMVILWWFAFKPRIVGQVSGLFLISYGLIRFTLEYFREPDSFLIDIPAKTGLTMGQWLCVPMIIAGFIIYVVMTKKKISLK